MSVRIVASLRLAKTFLNTTTMQSRASDSPRTGAATCRLCLRIRHGVDSNKRDVVDTKPEYVTKPIAPGGDQASAIVNMLQK